MGRGGTGHDPDFATLADWTEGRLGPEDAAQVAQRVAVAGPATRADLDWLRDFRALSAAARLPEPPAELADRLAALFSERASRALDRRLEILAATLVWDSFRDAGLVGVRSAAHVAARQVRHLVYDADGIDLTFDLYPASEGRVRVEGQVLPPPDVIAPVSAVQLLAGRRAVADALLDDLGLFTLPDVEEGPYELMLLGGALQIDVEIDLRLERDA